MNPITLFVFLLDNRRYALPLGSVERVVPAVDMTPLPAPTDGVAGVIDVQGRAVPVLAMRRLLHLPEKELDVNDRFIIARTRERAVVLVADEVMGIAEVSEQEMTVAGSLFPETNMFKGVARLNGGMVLLLELDKLLPNAPAPEMNSTEKRYA